MLKRRHGDSFVLLDESLNVVDWNPKPGVEAKWAELDIISVPHTGTNFLNKLVTDAGFMTVRCHHWQKKDLDKEGLILSPIRDPWKTWITWQSRNRQDDFFESWFLFNQVYQENPYLFILPIDTPAKFDYLKMLSCMLKVDIQTDWSPVESQPHKEVVKKDLSAIYNLSVVKKFYCKP